MTEITWREIIRDVRDRLTDKVLVLDSTYFTTVAPFDYPAESPEQRITRIVQAREECSACGLGSLFIGFIGIGGNPVYYNRDFHTQIIQSLLPYFDRETLDLVEMFFEGYEGAFIGMSEETRPKAHDLGMLVAFFKQDHETYPERLLAIFDNIEKNNGRFIPEIRLDPDDAE